MYQSLIKISKAGTATLEKELIRFSEKHKSLYSKSLCKKISLEKLPEVILERVDSKRNRLQCFDCAMDILKNSKDIPIPNIKNKNEFEIKGFSQDGEIVFLHLRKETDNKKNTQIFFVSCYSSKKPPSP